MLRVAMDWFFWDVLRLDPSSPLPQAINFFIHDSIKIIALLFAMILAIGFLRTFLPPLQIKQWLSGRKLGVGNFLASVFGAVTPFCSCSSIPLFLGFIKSGVPLGITFSFLITSPVINEYLVVLMLGFFGWKITAAYVLSGILIGVVSGIILGEMKLEKYLVADFIAPENGPSREREYKGFAERMSYGLGEAKAIVAKIWIWVLVGVGVGALIHNYVPQEVIGKIIAKGGPFTVVLATLLGVPLYGSCAAIVPIAVVLFQKGVPLGTALAFMMAVSALSLPEAVILRRAMKIQLILIFFGIVTLAIIMTGYLFNLLQGILV
jgi:uncharacterized protein